MNPILNQLDRWRLLERVVRLAWGGARWLAIVLCVLGVACALDWAIDRYSGSQTWRDILKSSWVFTGIDPLAAGETPYWFRLLMTAGQLALAGGLAYVLLIRPWVRTPDIDTLASSAEQAYPEFDHRLVTAIQLNRTTADTRGMSRVLIGEVTREAEDIGSHHNFLKLIDYRRLGWAAAVLAPVLAGWMIFGATRPALASILVQRQALLDVEIPRNIHLVNITQEVWPTGSEVTIRYQVSGQFSEDMVGVVRLVPDGQPEEFYELVFENRSTSSEEELAYFVVKLPPSSLDFSFQARLGGGRTRSPGRVTFEPPPQLSEDNALMAVQVLPAFLGTRPDGLPYTRRNEGWTRGEVIDALPGSQIIIDAKFNKPVKVARLVPIERGDGLSEQELLPVQPFETAADRTAASFGFPTTTSMIGYRIELEDDRGFVNPLPIRRNIRMHDDRPPNVEFKAESNRDPDPASPYGQGNPRDYEWDAPVAPNGRIQVIYNANSELGIREVNLRYRVLPRGVALDSYPEAYKRIQHPREDKDLLVYSRLPLKRFPATEAMKLGKFVPELGRFEKSGVFGEVEFFPLASIDPNSEPSELEAGGCKNFEVGGLLKRLPDGTLAKLEIGDTVELYLEAFDKLPGPDGKIDPDRPAGYTRMAKQKTVVTEDDARIAIRLRDEARQKLQDKLREIATDQAEVFKPKN